MALWEELFVVLILLKIPVAYVGYVLWWAIRATPEVGTEGGAEGMNWVPWRRPSPTGRPSRPHRGGPERARERVRQGQARRQARAGRNV